MAPTQNFKDTIKARAVRDPEFREALLVKGIECFLAGDVETSKTVLHDYINATVRRYAVHQCPLQKREQSFSAFKHVE